jgi:nicotinamidase-related amidase
METSPPPPTIPKMLLFNKRIGTKYTMFEVDPSKVALILIDIWDDHWCPSMKIQTWLLARQVNALLPSIRGNGIRIIHSPSECAGAYTEHERRKAFLEGPVKYSDPKGQKIKELPEDKGDSNNPPPVSPEIEGFPPELLNSELNSSNLDYRRLDPKQNKQCEGDTTPEAFPHRQPWKQESSVIQIKDPDVIAFENESYRIVNWLAGRGIEHLVYAGTATNFCILWSRNTSMYSMKMAIQTVVQKKAAMKPIYLYIARDLTDSCYIPDSDTIETHDVGTVESVGAIEALGFPSILSSDLVVLAPTQ